MRYTWRSMNKRAFVIVLYPLAALGAIGLHLLIASHVSWFATDWIHTYYPASILLLQGQNPYAVTTLHNPIWTLLFTAPFALLGPALGSLPLFLLYLGLFGFVAYRLKPNRWALISFILCPLVIYSAAIENIDALVLAGFLLPAPIGLFFVAMKPQIGIGVALYWAYEAWKIGGIRRLVLTFLPVTIALAGTFLLYGNWLTGRSDDILNAFWNLNLFPWVVPIGLLLTYSSIRREHVRPAIAASPLLSPYVGYHSWAVALVGLLENPALMISISAGFWVAVGTMIARGVGG